jgi:hypothetical protein
MYDMSGVAAEPASGNVAGSAPTDDTQSVITATSIQKVLD